MSEENRSIKSVKFYKNGNVKRIEFYEPAQPLESTQPLIIPAVAGTPQWIPQKYKLTSGDSRSYTATGGKDQLRQSVGFVYLPLSSSFRDMLLSPEEDAAWSEYER